MSKVIKKVWTVIKNELKQKSFETKCVAHHEIRNPVHPINTPIYSSSTYILDSSVNLNLKKGTWSKII